jgi:diguanylate cyclase (GGDEF)-like protein/PAS domain S-box-containing protein
MIKPAPIIEESTPNSDPSSMGSEASSPQNASSRCASFFPCKAIALTLPIAIAYVFLAWLVSKSFTLVSPIWPSAGVAVAAIMLYGRSALPGIFAGSLIANVLFYGWGPLGGILVSLGNTLSPMLGIALYKRSSPEDYFESPKSVGRYLLYVALIGSTFSALIGILSLSLFHYAGLASLLYSLLGWWVGDLSSTLILAPAFYLWGRWFQSGEHFPKVDQDTEKLFFVWIIMAAGSLLLFGYRGDGSVLHIGLMSLVLPPLIWGAQRFNPRIALTMFANIYVIAFGCTMLGRGPFAFFHLGESLTAVQMMGASISTAILIASVLDLQRRRVTESMHEINESLTERVAERTLELARSESRTRHILEMSPMPMLVTDLESGRTLFVNDVCLDLMGMNREQTKSIKPKDLWVNPEERQQIINRLKRGDVIRNQEVSFHHPNGGIMWLSLAVVLTQLDHRDALMVAFKDISRHKLREAELLSQATTDTLTGLYNRRQVREIFRRILTEPKEDDMTISICIFDLDHFKRINDESGHACGDKVLRSVADTLRHELREQDILARWGGEEFILIMPNTNKTQAGILLERFRTHLQESTILCDNGNLTSCTASFGVISATLKPNDVNSNLLDEWINEADIALYRAKRNGRNRIETN